MMVNITLFDQISHRPKPIGFILYDIYSTPHVEGVLNYHILSTSLTRLHMDLLYLLLVQLQRNHVKTMWKLICLRVIN